jgi:STE24 endopeptidase
MSSSRVGAVTPALFALAVAEAGVRLLSPARPSISGRSVEAEAYFQPAEIERGRRYARPQLALALASETLQVGVLALLAARDRRTRGRRPGAATGAREALRLVAALRAVSLPLAILSRRRSRAVGLDTQSWSGWASDLIKATSIGATLAAGAGAGLAEAMRRSPRRWWVAAAAGSAGAGTLFGVLGPVLLDPLFNDFKPLPEGDTRSDVLQLAEAAGVRVGEVYVVDASRRTTAANAYVNGLGPTKRVVLFDTLLDRYSRQEVRLVVAHELSHVRHRDVVRGIGLAALISPPVALATQRLSAALAPGRGDPGLAAVGLAFIGVSGPIAVLTSRLSRAMERRADAESLELAGDPEAFISFERAIALQNVADVEPPKWVRVLLASHPPTLERIGAAVAFRERTAA